MGKRGALSEVFPRCLPLAAILLFVPGSFGQGVGDARVLLAAQQAHLGAQPGTLVLDRAARLEGEITLNIGQSLRIDAPLSVGQATVHLKGHNEVRCDAPISLDKAVDLFVAEGAEDISVRGCDVTVQGLVGGYLLTATRSARVIASDNHLVNMALFNTHNTGGEASRTTDVTLTGNSSEFLKGGGPIGAYLLYVVRGTVANNRFRGTGHGIEWWGGDGNIGWGGADAVTGAGDLSITGNQCYAAGGACVWGSMGFNVTVSGNSADICSDVCFDTEGGVRNLFTGNVAQACGNGCYSAQMESVDAVFSGNFAYADAKGPALALVLIKHRNGNPAPHANLTITGNTLSCGTLCTAFASEGEGGLDLSHNTVTNGVFHFGNYTNSVRVFGNSLRFTVSLAGQAAILAPSLAGGHTSVIEANTVLSEGPPDPKAACIVQAWSDDNNTDSMRIQRNLCVGVGLGVITETAGHNAGAPHAVWIVRENEFSGVPDANQIVHRKTSGNEIYEGAAGSAP